MCPRAESAGKADLTTINRCVAKHEVTPGPPTGNPGSPHATPTPAGSRDRAPSRHVTADASVDLVQGSPGSATLDGIDGRVGEPGPARSGGGGGPGSQVGRRVGDGPIDDLAVLRALLTSPFTMLPVSRPDDFAARPSPAVGPGDREPSGSTFPTDLLHEAPDGVTGVFLGAGAPWGGAPSAAPTTPARPRPTHGGIEAAGLMTTFTGPCRG